MENIIYVQVLLTLTCSIMLVALCKRLEIPSVLAYLIVGFLLGQLGLEFFASTSNIHYLAEVGVIFMLFSLGLEFSIPRVVAMRKQVFVLGSLQVILSSSVFFLFAIAIGATWEVAVLAGTALSLSSTAIVTRQLNEQNELNSKHGTLSIATLLFQDMAAVPLLILVPILASNAISSPLDSLSLSLMFALAKGLGAIIILFFVGRWFLPKLFHEVAIVRSYELFLMTSLAVALVASWFTHFLGLSTALGAFLAGMLLAESQFKNQIETEIRPFKELLLGLFFITIGTLIDLTILIQHFVLITALLIILVSVKMLIIYFVTRLMHEQRETALKTGLALSHAGELGFVVLGLAHKFQVVSENQTSIILSAGALSMFIAPFLIRYSGKLTKRVSTIKQVAIEQFQSKQALSEQVKSFKEHVIICGFGRNGQAVKRFMDKMGFPSVIIDMDPKRVNEAATAGENIFYGDASRRSILQVAGIDNCLSVIVTFDDRIAATNLLSVTHHFFPEKPVIIRTKDDSYMETLLQAGASKVIPDTLESCLMLSGQVMYSLGVPVEKIMNELQFVRDDRYHLLQSFFHGHSSNLMRVLETHHEQLHAVVLTENAYAIGKMIKEINMPEKINIEAVKRNKQSFTPPERQLLLCSGDIILLSGDPDYIEQAENILFRG